MSTNSDEELLILTKTYPDPSTKYRETTCVAAISRQGALRRIFPVPFRFLDGSQQFKKWEWISARQKKAQDDHRPESFHIEFDTLSRTGERILANRDWADRRPWFEPHVVENFDTLERRRQTSGETLGIIRPTRLLALDITPRKKADGTDAEKAHLYQQGLFDSPDARSRPPLEKIPYTFHYRYECAYSDGPRKHRHMITDWEAAALYRNCFRRHGAQWERPFRKKLEEDFSKVDLHLLMGTVHRFPDQWLIVGLIYPPSRQKSVVGVQGKLAIPD